MTPLTDHDIKLGKLAYLRMKQRRNTALCLPEGSALPLVSATSAMCILPRDYSACQGSTAFMSLS